MNKKKTKTILPELYDVIRRPVVTEKAYTAAEDGNKVTFMVKIDAGKRLIKQAVEAIFDVKVEKINTIRMQGKKKRFRGIPGQRPSYKKAIVTLAEGSSIEFAG